MSRLYASVHPACWLRLSSIEGDICLALTGNGYGSVKAQLGAACNNTPCSGIPALRAGSPLTNRVLGALQKPAIESQAKFRPARLHPRMSLGRDLARRGSEDGSAPKSLAAPHRVQILSRHR